MALPPLLRYWLIRLKAWNRPLLWSVGLGLGLLAAVVYQHRLHPEWLGQFEVDGDAPGQATGNPFLSPEEQAGMAEIDTLADLYRDFGLDTGGTAANTPDAAAIAASEDTLLALLQDPERTADPGGNRPNSDSDSSDPTADRIRAYLEQYRFLGGSSTNSSSSSSGSSRSSPEPNLLPGEPSTLRVNPGAGTVPGDPTAAATGGDLALSPLAQAVLQLRSPEPGENGIASSALPGDSGLLTGAPQTPTANSQPNRANASPTQPPWLVEGVLPGTRQSFIRTVPEMSPPPGTTGYVPPASLNLLPPGGLAPGQPLGAIPLTPNLAAPTTSQGMTISPSGPGGSAAGGSVLPPATGSLYEAPALSPPPFTVTRPPGSHSGGGFIYTFSDPKGAIP